MSRRLFSGQAMSASQALKRTKLVARRPSGGIDRELKRQIDAGWRSFWARRGRDVASFGFRGDLGA